jgi:hypothetical protein
LREAVASGVGAAGDRISGTAECVPHNEIAPASKARNPSIAAVLELLAETWPHSYRATKPALEANEISASRSGREHDQSPLKSNENFEVVAGEERVPVAKRLSLADLRAAALRRHLKARNF